jgi:tetratricopeptide (TPR) repeat protein
MIALILATVAAATLLYATGQFRSSESQTLSIADLEKIIGAGKAKAETWQAYGDALRNDKRFGNAAEAYQRSIEMDPDRPQARFNEALSLAQANAADKFFEFFAQLTAHDPKQAVDLLERPELAGMHRDGRWEQAASSARAQAAD